MEQSIPHDIMRLLVASLVILAACAPRQSPTPNGAASSTSRVRMTFVPASDSLAAAAREYTDIWTKDGARIVEAMERRSGLSFVSPDYADTAIVANVVERASNSGYRERPMTLRASYPADTKRATLIHELGHRLQSGLFRGNEEEHIELFYWVYDTWVELYGQQFADVQVAVEKQRSQRYVDAWNAALSLNKEERAAKWKAIREERMGRR